MRTIIFILALLGAVVGRGQIVLDWYGAAAPAATLLLDDYPNAAVAFSLRALNSAYTGNCIQVRRSNDNATQNIGFAGGIVDTAALKTFCGANNCFVRTWYDQSGNGNNATQTTNANQPLIVSSGNVLNHNQRPVIQLGVSGVFRHMGFTSTSFASLFMVAKNDSLASANYILTTSSTLNRGIHWGGIFAGITGISYFDGTATIGSVNNNFLQYLASYHENASSDRLHINALSAVTGSATAINLAHIGGSVSNGALRHLGNVSEIIIYTNSRLSDVSAMHTNIMNFYGL